MRCFHGDDYQVSMCDRSKSDHVCGSESWHEQRRSRRTSEKELLLLIRLEKVTKPSLKCWPQIHSQIDCVQMEKIHYHRYPPQGWSTNKVVVISWFGHVFLHMGQDGLNNEFCIITANSEGKCQDI